MKTRCLFVVTCLLIVGLGLNSGWGAEKAAKGTGAGPGQPLSPAPNLQVAIPRTGLGKEYLLSASIIPQALAPTSTGLAGRVVRFELFHDGVDLYESTQGQVVTDDLPARRLITTFPIVGQDDDKVVIDFNKGMERVYTDIWYAAGAGYDPAARTRSLEVPRSRVFEVTRSGDQLVIRQSAQARNRQADQNTEVRYEVRYFLKPYQPGDYQAKETTPIYDRNVRFFEIQPQLELTSGRVTRRVSRFDIREPVTFYYSANTPEDYQEAVKGGILYWNKAFGKEVVKAERAPRGVSAPDHAHNMVQWVPWENAGFAYADLLGDPLTGEAQHGQAYMTSVFAISGRARARALLRSLRATVESKEKGDGKATPGSPFLHFDFLPSASVCSVDPVEFAQQMVDGLEKLLAEEKLTDEAVLRASQDYVRLVVAHEVGHILGLRHNFAASLTTSMSPKDLDNWFSLYVTDAKTNAYATNLTSSSVMEYNNFVPAAFLGAWMRRSEEALPYDKAAIQWGYFDSEAPREQRTLFGTDQQTAEYGDVVPFDYGSDPVLAAYAGLAEDIRKLPIGVVETFIAAKAPRDPRDRRPLEQVSLPVSGFASGFGASYERILRWFKSGTRSIQIENDFELVGELTRKEILKARWTNLNQQVERLGGIDRVLFAYLPVDLKLELKEEPRGVQAPDRIDAKKLTERLSKLLDSPAYTNFVGLDEKTYSFTKEEKELIVKRGQRYFEELEREIVKRVCGVLETANRDLGTEANGSVAEDDLVARLEKRIIDFCKLVITDKHESERRRGKVDKSFVEVVEFKYNQETRLAAAKALNDNVGSFKGWATDAKGDLNKQLKDEVEGALNIQNFKSFQESMLTRPLREWYMGQQALLALLPPRKPAEPPK